MRSSAFVTVCVQPGGPSRHVETESLRASTFFARCCQSKIHQSREKKTTTCGTYWDLGVLDHLENDSMIKISLWPCDSAGEDRWCSGNSWGNWGCFRKHRYGRNLHVLHMLMCLWLIMMFFPAHTTPIILHIAKCLPGLINIYIYIHICM